MSRINDPIQLEDDLQINSTREHHNMSNNNSDSTNHGTSSSLPIVPLEDESSQRNDNDTVVNIPERGNSDWRTRILGTLTCSNFTYGNYLRQKNK